ncbi:MAG: (2Fe-2S)-binding protein [Deltaproteobacteria bacterium]|nr:(2Fe-2S)-binding protein [Deltaproteobacteria bacterium]
MPKLTIDGQEIELPEGTNLIEAARKVGASIPHYCYHSKLSIAGNCRICQVEIEKQPKLQIACNTKVAEGMVVHTKSPRVLEARQGVLEFILVNHPIDCPVCDQAGECKLQKYYMQHDRKPSRMEEEKVHKEKAIRLGPNVMLDMERCILCSRCIRFCQEIAHEDQLCFTERGDHTELTCYPGKELDNAYSMNTVDICPVGALTSSDFRFKQRVWFLKSTDSVCPGCATGCNIKVQQNKGVIYRLLPRENPEVNQGWMCDEGRMTYKEVNEPNRLRTPFVRTEKGLESMRMKSVLQQFVQTFRGIDPGSIVGIGSALGTNEDNLELMECLQEIGVKDFYFHAKEASNPSQDQFLISPDKNPNRAGVIAIGMKPLKEANRKYQGFVALGGVLANELTSFSFEKGRKVALFVTHQRPEYEYADFLLPVASWAESDGSFTNKKGMKQKILPAFPPHGEARPAHEIFKEIQTEWKSSPH